MRAAVVLRKTVMTSEKKNRKEAEETADRQEQRIKLQMKGEMNMADIIIQDMQSLREMIENELSDGTVIRISFGEGDEENGRAEESGNESGSAGK